MNCRDFEADVVDLARGAEMDATAAARLSAHLERCAGCASRLTRERHLTAALRAMADTAPPPARTAAIEAQLLIAFVARQGTDLPKATVSRQVIAFPAAYPWLAAAAVLVLAVVVWQGGARWRAGEDVRSNPASASKSPEAAQPAGPPPAQPDVSSIRTPPGAAPALARPLRADVRPASARGPVPAPAAEDEVLRFVSLPTAVGLPALESGRIVRVELPTAMLPAYGLDVAPDAAAGFVEADVLVGQDGQPRAIRFVTLNQDSRRRQ